MFPTFRTLCGLTILVALTFVTPTCAYTQTAQQPPIQITPVQQAELNQLVQDCDQAYTKNDFAAAERLGRTGLEKAKVLGDKFAMARFLLRLAHIYSDQYKFDAAFEYLRSDIQLLKELGDKPFQLAQTYYDLGNAYSAAGLGNEAIDCYSTSLNIYTSLNNSPGIANCLNLLGESYRYLGQHENALRYYKRLETFGEAQKNKMTIADGLSGQALINGGLEQSMALHYRAIRLYETLDTNEAKEGIARNCNNLSAHYLFAGRFSEALELRKRALRLYRAVADSRHAGDDLPHIATTLNLLGSFYERMGQNDQAKAYYAQALDANKNEKNRSLAVECLVNLGNISAKSGKYEEALQNYQKASSILLGLSEDVSGSILLNITRVSGSNTCQDVGLTQIVMSDLEQYRVPQSQPRSREDAVNETVP